MRFAERFALTVAESGDMHPRLSKINTFCIAVRCAERKVASLTVSPLFSFGIMLFVELRLAVVCFILCETHVWKTHMAICST